VWAVLPWPLLCVFGEHMCVFLPVTYREVKLLSVVFVDAARSWKVSFVLFLCVCVMVPVFFVCLFVFCLVFELRDFHFMGRYYTTWLRTAGFFLWNKVMFFAWAAWTMMFLFMTFTGAGIRGMSPHIQLFLLRVCLTNFLPRLAWNHDPS
jgi:hypothetical protein